jgi:hypothetical protein
MNRFNELINRLARFSKNKKWLKESSYIKYEVIFAISERHPVFVEKSYRFRNNVVAFDLEWKGKGKAPADINKDFYKIYGEFAEREQYIKRETHKNYMTFWIIMGCCDKNFHGHLLRINIVGSRIKKLLLNHRIWRKNNPIVMYKSKKFPVSKKNKIL